MKRAVDMERGVEAWEDTDEEDTDEEDANEEDVSGNDVNGHGANGDGADAVASRIDQLHMG